MKRHTRRQRIGRQRILSGLIAALVVGAAVCIVPHASGPAVAQQPKQEQQPMLTEIKQIKLTEKHIQGFLTSQRGIIAISDKIEKAVEKAGDMVDDKLLAELDQIAKKGGFPSFLDFEDVRTNIMIVLAGIDPENGTYTDPIDLIKKDIEAIKADKSMPEADRKQQLEELTEALKEMQPLQYKENIALVQKHFKAIDEVLK